MKSHLFSALLVAGHLGAHDQPLSSLDDFQKFQVAYDAAYFQLNDDEFEKLRHITLHLMKTVAKAASFCEVKEHGREADPDALINEVTPDLLMHALQIANLFQVDLGDKFQERVESNIRRITGSK